MKAFSRSRFPRWRRHPIGQPGRHPQRRAALRLVDARRARCLTDVADSAGQTSGPVFGNGRATCVLFARACAHVVALDRDQASAEETAAMIEAEGGSTEALVADVAEEQR